MRYPVNRPTDRQTDGQTKNITTSGGGNNDQNFNSYAICVLGEFHENCIFKAETQVSKSTQAPVFWDRQDSIMDDFEGQADF